MENGVMGGGSKEGFIAEIESLIERDRASIKRVDSIIRKVSRTQGGPAKRQKLRDLRAFKKEIQKSAEVYEKFLKKVKPA